jgi:hypothetical protein
LHDSCRGLIQKHLTFRRGKQSLLWYEEGKQSKRKSDVSYSNQEAIERMTEQHSKKRPASDVQRKSRSDPLDPELSSTLPNLGVEATLSSSTAMQSGHNRLLVVLLLIAGFIFASFPVSDPDIFPSLRVGQMVVAGEFPWGEDPFGYADGEHAAWIHPGWLGDVIIYALYSIGGGPALVLTRATLVVFLLFLLLHLGTSGRTCFLTVLTALLGLLALCPRLYMRTEFFSYVCLAVTFWVLMRSASGALPALRRWTAGRWYWVIPPLFLIWANLDEWFFLGPVIVLIWFLASLVKNALSPSEKKALAIVLVLGILASLCTPFHVKSYAAIPTLFQPPTSTELAERYDAQIARTATQTETGKQVPIPTPPAVLRLFISPWSGDFFFNHRKDVFDRLATDAPLLARFYPKGLSLAEWALYPFTLLVVLALLARWRGLHLGVLLLIILFGLLGAWQSRLVGFFAIAGMALVIFQLQNQPSEASGALGRLQVMSGQLARLGLALVLQLCCLIMLILVPDGSLSLGYLHPRGAFGYAFRYDPSEAQIAEQLHTWSTASQLPGQAFHVDWTDVAQYNPWFNPGGRTFFDRRYEVHSAKTAAAALEIIDSLRDVSNFLEVRRSNREHEPDALVLNRQRESAEQRKQRQSIWQRHFKLYDISYVVVRDTSTKVALAKDKEVSVSLVSTLLDDRDERNEPVWEPLDRHNGQAFVLAWTGSKHWPKLKSLIFSPGEVVFRGSRSHPTPQRKELDPYSLAGFFWGDPPRRPAAIDESRWDLLLGQRQRDREFQMMGEAVSREIYGAMITRFGGQVASPAPQLFLPFFVSGEQLASASSNYLALAAAQRGVAELALDAPARQRADAWDQLLKALAELTAYEQRLSPASASFREPLRLHAALQAAAANEAAIRPRALELHLQLALLFRNRHLLDTAWEHYQAAIAFGERHAAVLSDKPSQFLEKLPDAAKQAFGGSITEFENLLKSQQMAWEQEVNRLGWSAKTDTTNKYVAQRATLALQSGLANKALSEVLAAKTVTTEIAAIATTVCMELGLYDLMLENYLLPHPELRAAIREIDYHQKLGLGWWCKGLPREAASEYHIVAELTNIESLRSLIVASSQTIFGTSLQPPGSVISGSADSQRSTAGSLSVADQEIAEGMLLLEAGEPREAARVFLATLRDVEPKSPWRPLIARYYLQITGRTIETDLDAK